MLKRIAAALDCSISELIEEQKNEAICPHCLKPVKLKKAD